jgi:hypothetical protein
MSGLIRTSCVDFISSIHGEQRRIERLIEKRDLQAAVKYGLREDGRPHPRTGEPRLKFTYNGVVYITDRTKKIEVTSYALENLPLLKADIDVPLSRQITEQKRRIISGEKAATSHTVIVVDQSGSMNSSDIMGHRCRSRGAFYTIASELIGQPLIRDQLSFTDVFTIIDMRDTSEIIIWKQPCTWELHNMIVDLADDALRARGHGNYLPALSMASQALSSIKDDNCALLLLFLSDGGPSDAHTSASSCSLDLCKLDILSRVGSICELFGPRLTFGTFGFAHDHETKDGKVFDLLRDMATLADRSCAKAVFSCGLDTAGLRKVLFSMSKTLLSTRTKLSSLAGGSAMRITGKPKVKRTDMVKDDGEDEQFDEWLYVTLQFDAFFVDQNSLQRVVARRDRHVQEGGERRTVISIEWDYVCLMHPNAVGIRVKRGYLGRKRS